MPAAARVTDLTTHGAPLGSGPGSDNVTIGFLKAWRALPAAPTAAAVEAAAAAVKAFMSSPSLTPATAAVQMAAIEMALQDAAAKSEAEGNAGPASATSSALAKFHADSAQSGAKWATDSAPPGALPAATLAYTESIKAAMADAAGAVFSSIAGATDMHQCPTPCPTPPHGPGVVTRGSKTVTINGLPATRQGDKVFEACGGSDPIAAGLATVIIGDLGASGDAQTDGGDAHETPQADAPEPEPEDAADPSDQKRPGESSVRAGVGTHWLEIELVDEAEQPVAGEQYRIRLPDGKEIRGGLDPRGQVRLTGIKNPGACQIRFPELDLAAWERWRPMPPKPPAPLGATAKTTPAPRAGGAATGSGPGNGRPHERHDGNEVNEQPQACPPVAQAGPARGGDWRTVRQGDCVASIGKETGHFWRTIWEHAANSALRNARLNPNVLRPQDAVFVPDKRPKEDSGQTDQHHKFRRRGEPAMLCLLVENLDGPRRNEPFRLVLDDQEFKGTTDGAGRIRQPIRPNARRAKLFVGASGREAEYALELGCLDPVESICGVQARLNNLGFDCGPVDGRLGPRTRAALKRFQAACDLPPTGTPDVATQEKLKEQHGC